jgi:murein L,D-transpeptidase YafK
MVLGLSVSLLPPQLLAQAGSRPAILFESAASFYHSINDAGQSGLREFEAVVPDGLWMLPAGTPWLMWVELEQGRLNVLERDAQGGLILRKRIPVSIGKQGIGKNREGDQKTPIGTYRIVSFLDDGSIDDFYGPGAYPLNYPNVMDRRLARTGHGIWLHGLPSNVGERPFLDSDGCVVIDNQSLMDLAGVVATGATHIVLSKTPIRWISVAEQRQQRGGLEHSLQAWRKAWEQRDHEAYLAFYADDFSDFSMNKSGWANYKRRVNGNKQFIRLQFSEISMIVDPVQQELVTVRYLQDYQSNDYQWQGWKEQIWRHNDSRWEIIYEGNG